MSNEERENVTTERAGLSRRQVLQRGAVIGGAIWIPPIVQSIRVPAAAAVGSPAPCITDTGRLTGSGYAYISGTSGPKVHYDTRGNLNCVPDGTEKFEIDWTIVTGTGRNKVTTNYQFDLSAITSVACSLNGAYLPLGPNANFNEISGTGVGTLSINGVAQSGTATVIFDLIDGGEPGIGNDHVSLTIQYPGTTTFLQVTNQPLTAGNLQTHGNTAFGNACV